LVHAILCEGRFI
jgi:hypothetical protein